MREGFVIASSQSCGRQVREVKGKGAKSLRSFRENGCFFVFTGFYDTPKGLYHIAVGFVRYGHSDYCVLKDFTDGKPNIF